MDLIALHEAVELSPGLRIDEDAGVVFGVKILGNVSRNGLTFPSATRAAAHKLMEGAHVNWDHRPKGAKETSLSSRFGWLTNVREDVDANCTRADLNYLKGHKEVPLFLSIAKQRPQACGFSILGGAKPGPKDAEGRIIVEQITKVDSFDLVADPANTLGLREAMDVPVVPDAPVAGAPAGKEGAADSDDYTAIGCMKAIMEIANGSGTDREKLDAITKHVQQALEMDGKGKTEEGEEEEAESEKADKGEMKESWRRIRQKNCIELCESHKIEPTNERIQLLIFIPRRHREDRVKKMALVTKPRSGIPATPLRESATSPPPPPPAETDEQITARLARAFKGY